MNPNLTSRYLKVIIGIGTGQMGDGTPGEFYTLINHRMSAAITSYGGETQGQAVVKIYGMSLDLMNRLTTIGPVNVQIRAANSIQILAGDDPKALTTIYNGTIQTAFADFNNAPDVAFEVTALAASVAAMGKPQPTSYSGVVTVDTIMRDLANKIKFEYLNVDVKAVLNNPTFNGSYLDQIKDCAYAADIDFNTDNFSLKIKNRFSAYPGDIAQVSPENGMVGYPLLNSNGIAIKTIFLPTIIQGGKMEVSGSQIAAANKKWVITNVTHELESILPDGKWFTTCSGFPDGLTSP
jgi:hypothetical protein